MKLANHKKPLAFLIEPLCHTTVLALHTKMWDLNRNIHKLSDPDINQEQDMMRILFSRKSVWEQILSRPTVRCLFQIYRFGGDIKLAKMFAYKSDLTLFLKSYMYQGFKDRPIARDK